MNSPYNVTLGSVCPPGTNLADGSGEIGRWAAEASTVSEIVSWPQAVVAVTFIIASIVVPQVLSYLSRRPR